MVLDNVYAVGATALGFRHRDDVAEVIKLLAQIGVDVHVVAPLDASAADIAYTSLFSGVHGNYLKPSIAAAGLDPDNLPAPEPGASYRKRDDRPPAWKTIWGAGQGVGAIDAVQPVAAVVARLASEYHAARRALAAAAITE